MPDGFDKYLIAYSIGTLGVVAECYAYSLHDGQRFRRWSGASALLWAAMYFGLDAMTAAVTMGSTALRTLWSNQPQQGAARGWAVFFFLSLFAGLTAVSWQGTVSLLPAFAVMNTTLALFYLGNIEMRWVLLLSSVAWIWNDVLWNAWPALVAESFAALISLQTLYRLHQKARVANDP